MKHKRRKCFFFRDGVDLCFRKENVRRAFSVRKLMKLVFYDGLENVNFLVGFISRYKVKSKAYITVTNRTFRYKVFKV